MALALRLGMSIFLILACTSVSHAQILSNSLAGGSSSANRQISLQASFSF